MDQNFRYTVMFYCILILLAYFGISAYQFIDQHITDRINQASIMGVR